MAYLNEHIQECRLKRDDITTVTDAAGESNKIPRLQQALQEFDENFDVVGLVNFNWGHSTNEAFPIQERYLCERSIPQSKSTVIKHKYALRTHVQDVRHGPHGTADCSATPEPEIQGSGHASRA